MSDEFRFTLHSAKFVAQYTTLALIIIAGATTNTLVQLKHAREGNTIFDWIDFVIAFLVACFSGIMFALGAAYFSDDTIVVHGVSGAGAFLGLVGLNKLTDTILTTLAQKVGNER